MGSLSLWPLSSTAFLCAWQHYSTSVPIWIATCSGWWFADQRADFGEIIHQSSGWWITDQRVLFSSYPCGEVLVIFDSFATYMRTVERIFSFREESWISNSQHVEYCIKYFISSSKFMNCVSSFVWLFFFGGSTYFYYLDLDLIIIRALFVLVFQLILSNSFYFLFFTTGGLDAYHNLSQTLQKWELCAQGTTFMIMKKKSSWKKFYISTNSRNLSNKNIFAFQISELFL